MTWPSCPKTLKNLRHVSSARKDPLRGANSDIKSSGIRGNISRDLVYVFIIMKRAYKEGMVAIEVDLNIKHIAKVNT